MTENIMAPGSVRITPRPDKSNRIDVVQVWSPSDSRTVAQTWDVEEARTEARRAVDHAQTVLGEAGADAKVYDGTRPTCTYGGTCTEQAVRVFTRTDHAHPAPQTAYGCAEHYPTLHDHMSRYVGGWGMVTFTVDVIR